MQEVDNPVMISSVHESLTKLGFVDCEVRDYRNKKLTLLCPSADRNDRSMIQVAVRLIPGINSVAFESQK